MELRQLRYFVAVAEELHFGRAAARLNMAQPPLSQQIKKLEEDIGVVLFARNRASVKLTSAGIAFLAEVKSTFTALEQAVQAARQAARGELGHVTVGIIPSLMDGGGPALVEAFKRRQPGAMLQIQQLPASDVVTALRNRRIDLAITRTFDAQKDIDQTIIARENLIAVLPAKHPLAAHKRIETRELKDEGFILFERTRETGLYDAIYGTCESAGFRPKIVMISNVSIHALIAIVATGTGISIVPESTKSLKRDGVVYRPLNPNSKELEVVVAYRAKDNNVLVQRFVEDVHHSKMPSGRNAETV